MRFQTCKPGAGIATSSIIGRTGSRKSGRTGAASRSNKGANPRFMVVFGAGCSPCARARSGRMAYMVHTHCGYVKRKVNGNRETVSGKENGTLTPSQTIQVRQSEIRERVRVLLEKGELSETEKTEKTSLLNEQRELEPKLRAALSARGRRAHHPGRGPRSARETRIARARFAVWICDGGDCRPHSLRGRFRIWRGNEGADRENPHRHFRKRPSPRGSRGRCDSRAGDRDGRCRGSDSTFVFSQSIARGSGSICLRSARDLILR